MSSPTPDPTPTEADALLRSGALYGRRVLLRPGAGDPVFAGWKAGAFSLYCGDDPIVHADPEGRWQRAVVGGRHYLKGLDGRVQAIDRVREGANMVLWRRPIPFAEAGDLDALVRDLALDLLAGLVDGRLTRVDSPAGPVPLDDIRSALESLACWDAAAWFAHREAYLAAYGPLPILPPDCPPAVVLQATLGQEAGRAFGGGPAATYYVRTPAEFEAHASAVCRLLGRRAEQCKAVFLAGADALRRPTADVLAWMDAAATVFPIDPTGAKTRGGSAGAGAGLAGVHGFLDRFDGPLPDFEGWRALRAAGLVRVTLGVESGAAEVREAAGRLGWTNDELLAAAGDVKRAGIGLGVLALAGAGGAGQVEWSDRATARLVNELPLGPGDVVSVVDAAEFRPGGPGPRDPVAAAAGRSTLINALRPVRDARGAKVVPYSLAKQGAG